MGLLEMIKIKQKNILRALKKGEIDIIAHGCNCKNSFKSGIAGQIKKEFPKASESYHNLFKDKGVELGDVDIVEVKKGKYIVNCMTQFDYGNSQRTNITYLDIQALKKCLIEVKNFSKKNNLKVGLPKIGCGLAGGDWSEVKSIIEGIFKDYPVEIYYYGDWDESKDGIEFINVYSKGKTSLGKKLSNFAYSPIKLKDDGNFKSIEGYWYWLITNDDNLRNLWGFEAKRYARSIGAEDWIEDPKLKKKVLIAIREKIIQNKIYLDMIKSDLPFVHFYEYKGRVIPVPKADWIMDYLEKFRQDLKKKVNKKK